MVAIGGYQAYRIPRPQHVSFDNRVTRGEFDEFRYDINTNSYLSRGQDEEINKLKDEIENSKKEKRQDLENIIGYFYARK